MKDFAEKIRKLRRGPQVILPKDIGMIITETGIGKDSVVLEAGTGSGMLTSYLANICKKVISYERRSDFYELSKNNFKNIGFRNIKQINKDILDSKEKNIDVMILDLPNPHDYIEVAKRSLKEKGFLVCYLPSITQIELLLKHIENLKLIRVSELIRRDWIFDNDRIRPKSKIIGHTGFIIFIKKV